MSDCCQKTKRRSEEELKKLTHRLSRIEGQIRGIKKMVEADAYCTDVITQVSAVQSALSAFNKELLSEHVRSCVKEGLQNGDDEVIEELVTTIQKMTK